MIQMNLFAKEIERPLYRKETYGYKGESDRAARRNKLEDWDQHIWITIYVLVRSYHMAQETLLSFLY